MVTAAPFIPLLLGQLVRHRIDPLITPLVGLIGGLVFGHQNPVLVRWPGGLVNVRTRRHAHRGLSSAGWTMSGLPRKSTPRERPVCRDPKGAADGTEEVRAYGVLSARHGVVVLGAWGAVEDGGSGGWALRHWRRRSSGTGSCADGSR
jgi:hypothetical protein